MIHLPFSVWFSLTTIIEGYDMGLIDILMGYARERLNYRYFNGVQLEWNNYSGCSALHLAAKADSTDIINTLFINGADINIQDDNGYTPVMYAIIYHSNNALKTLIKLGADLNIYSKYDGDSIALATLSKNTEAVEILNSRLNH